MSKALEAIRKKLRKDSTWKSFRSIRDNAWKPEFENFGDEILRLHKTREIRLLKRGNRASKLSDAALQDQATRSRCVEIAAIITLNRNYLERAINNALKHLETHYGSYLFSKGCKTKMEQKAVYEVCMADAKSKMEQMDTIIEVADRVIDDIDKGSFAIKHSLDALQIATKREYA